jgi:beta-glucanase (GH16 family)
VTPPPPPPGDTTPPTLTIANHASEVTASGNITFDFTFSEDVGTSFAASDVVVSGGSAGAFTRISPTVYSLVVIPAALASGTAAVSVPVGAFSDPSGNANLALSQASQAYDTTHAGWNMVWSDEFDTPGLPDASKWDYDTGRNREGWFNDEKQYYSRERLENAKVEGGNLIITARKEALSSAPDWGGQQYTSARLLTRGKASWTYGLMEVRAKLPCGVGTWPAIWMLGTGGRWPDDGEIDIMEQVGRDPNVILGTVHTLSGFGGGGVGDRTTLTDACTAFHTYRLTWTSDKIIMGVDGADYFTYAKTAGASNAQWPFDRPQFMILNLAIGGTLGGAIDNSIFPREMQVDFVRVYQR